MWPETMTRETLELRQVVESGVNVWAFDYPSYYKGDEKKAFEKKVLDHFWMRQIGAETVGRFLHYFRRTVREIMPYYIQRYQSVDLMKDPEIRPLDNYNMIEEYEGEQTNMAESNASGTNGTDNNLTRKESGHSAGAESDTPQGALDMSINGSTLALAYASKTEQGLTGSDVTEDSFSTETHASNGKSTGEGTDKHKLTRRGNIGVTTYSDLLEGYRKTFLNIDMEIINELESCFLGVY